MNIARRKYGVVSKSYTKKHAWDELEGLVYRAHDAMHENLFDLSATLSCIGLAIDRNNLDCLRNLAMVCCMQDQTKDGLQIAEEALQVNPQISSIKAVRYHCIRISHLPVDSDKLPSPSHELDEGSSEFEVDWAYRIYEVYPELAVSIAESLLERYGSNLSSGLLKIFKIVKRYSLFDWQRKIDWLHEFENKLRPEEVPLFALDLLSLASSHEENVRVSNIIRSYNSHLVSTSGNASAKSTAYKSENNNRIRLAFLGGDFYKHVISNFLLPLVSRLDQSSFELFFIHTGPTCDNITEQYSEYGKLIHVYGRTQEDVQSEVIGFSLDIAIDLAGFTSYGPAPLMVKRIAKVQLSMYGYPGSMFLTNYDFLLVTKELAPKCSLYYSERLLEIEGVYACYRKAEDFNSDISLQAPQERNGFINFGVFINPYKYTAECIKAWAAVLESTPNSQICIIRPECNCNRFRVSILREFASCGIGPERILILNNHGQGISHFDCYNNIDVSLDTFPMTGGTSTVDSLMMGVPIVTLEGDNFHQRLSSSVLMQTGLSDCIAQSVGSYIAIASVMARDVTKLRELRKLAKQVSGPTSVLFEADSYSRRFEECIMKGIRDCSGEIVAPMPETSNKTTPRA